MCGLKAVSYKQNDTKASFKKSISIAPTDLSTNMYVYL